MRALLPIVGLLLLGCERPAAAHAVATVNGVAITEAELNAVLKPSAHLQDGVPAERKQAALAALVRDEQLRQKAVEAGLEPEAAALDELKRLEAQVLVARRRAYADAWLKKELERVQPTEADARAVFERERAVYATEYRVQQILLRDEAQIERAAAALKAGTPFEDVARAQYPGLPEGVGVPWELGFLSWKQLPEPWRPVLATLQPGQASGVIRGPSNRFWLVRLVETRARPDATFEELQPLILEDLKRARLEALTRQ
ncbi:MAG TPA: peptidyl-prolyl cis-trans isomerase [Archangium sp.]